MRLSILIPYRGATPHWQQVFARTQREWRDVKLRNEDLDIEIVVGEQHDSGPMHVARCVNDAASRATGDVFVLWGADHWPDPLCMRWLANTMSGNPDRMWQPLFENTGIVARKQTYQLINGESLSERYVKYELMMSLCIGIFAIRREAFFAVGEEDERFIGWGMEDAALRHVLTAFYGESPSAQKGSVLKALWHPLQPRTDRPALNNIEIYHNEYLAHGFDKAALQLTIDRARRVRLSGVRNGA
jgi:hypothetical protein